MVVLTRTYRFCASHRYWRDEWSESQNRAAFGDCALPHGHGHNYRLRLEIEGEPDAATGMVVDLSALDALVEREVLDRFAAKCTAKNGQIGRAWADEAALAGRTLSGLSGVEEASGVLDGILRE